MRLALIFTGAAALLAGCNQNSEQQAAEGVVRAAVGVHGNVQQVALTRQADNNYTGTATIRRPDGQLIGFQCTVTRTGSDANVSFSANCGQVLDQALLDEIKASLRRSIEGTGASVVQLDMSRRDDNTATGSGQVRNPDGSIVQLTCEAARQADGTFNYRCQPVSEAAAPAPAPGEEEAAPAEQQ